MSKPTNSPKPINATLLWAALVSAALLIVPGGVYVTLPLVYLNTIVHETCHALMALLTGGSVARIEVFASGAGVTLTRGGISVLIASAGYVGAAVVGAGLILASKTSERSRRALWILFGAIFLALALWVRGDAIGLGASIVWLALLALAAKKLKGPQLVFALQFLGLQQGIYAFQSLWTLLKINAVAGMDNDAAFASQAVPLPPMLYALSWCAISCLAMWFALRQVARSTSRG